jgi:ureidoacrylate peracid hydrolase
VAQEHWCSSGFANTDLDLQLKKHGIQRLIVVGLIEHTCVEATIRFAAELGYEVTLVKDATADYSDEEMHRRRRHQHSELRDSRGDDR